MGEANDDAAAVVIAITIAGRKNRSNATRNTHSTGSKATYDEHMASDLMRRRFPQYVNCFILSMHFVCIRGRCALACERMRNGILGAIVADG